MKSAILFTLPLAFFVVGALGALRPKRSAAAEYCHGRPLCTIFDNWEPSSTGYDPSNNNDLQCTWKNTGPTTCEYDPITGARTSGPTYCPTPPTPGIQCRNEDQNGNPKLLEFADLGWLYCSYGTAASSEDCDYQLSNGAPAPGNGVLCPPQPIDCSVSPPTNPTRRHSADDNLAAVKRKLEARAANGSRAERHGSSFVRTRSPHA